MTSSGAWKVKAMLTNHEHSFLMKLLEQKPREVLSLLAGQLLNDNLSGATCQPPAKRPEVDGTERRAGDDPYLIDEDEFAYRARYMGRAEQDVLRCRVNAARAHKSGRLDLARRFRQRADNLEKKLV